MKILVVCQYFYPEQFKVNDICFELSKNGHAVTVLTGLPNYPHGKIERKYKWFRNRKENIYGVNVIRSWLIGRKSGKINLASNYLSFAVSSLVKSLFMKKDFDLILVYQLSPVTMALPGILMKKITKKPLVIYCHDLWPESISSAGISKNTVIYSLLLKISKWIYKQADQILLSSKLFENYFREMLHIEEDFIYLPVYAESLFENIELQYHEKETLDLVFAGNIGEMQSVETIIYAANELKNENHIKWHIVGDGSARIKCENLATQLNLINVIFHGQYPMSEMPKFYNMADAFLVTLKANEFISYTLPNKVQSYMAASKPIIGAINGETQVVINESESGLCCDAEDFKALAVNVKLFEKEKKKRKTYGLNAKKYYEENFSKKIYFYRLYNALSKYK